NAAAKPDDDAGAVHAITVHFRPRTEKCVGDGFIVVTPSPVKSLIEELRKLVVDFIQDADGGISAVPDHFAGGACPGVVQIQRHDVGSRLRLRQKIGQFTVANGKFAVGVAANDHSVRKMIVLVDHHAPSCGLVVKVGD